MAPWLIIVIGTVVFVGGIMGSFHYQAVHKRLLQGRFFQNGPPEITLLTLWAATGIGGMFVLMGIFR